MQSSRYPARYVGYFHWSGAVTVTIGLVLHGCNALFGMDVFLATLGNPKVDLFLYTFMIYAAVGMLMFYPMVRFERPWRKYFYWFVTFYFWISVPVHVRVQLTQSAEMIAAFPQWYSPALLPYLGFLLYFFVTLKFQPPPELRPVGAAGEGTS